MSEIYFIRHAQASYMSANYDKLSAKGETQSAILGSYLVEKNIRFDQTFVGPLVRQKSTLEIVSNYFKKQGLTLPAPHLLEALREHTGPKALKLSYDKLLKEDEYVREIFPTNQDEDALAKKKLMLVFKYFMNKWVTGTFQVDHSEVEPWAIFRKKVKDGLASILEKTPPKSTIGVFTSGGVIAAITAEALGIKEEAKVADLNYAVRNTSFSKFMYSKGEFNLMSFNEIPHLEEEMITFV